MNSWKIPSFLREQGKYMSHMYIAYKYDSQDWQHSSTEIFLQEYFLSEICLSRPFDSVRLGLYEFRDGMFAGCSTENVGIYSKE